MRMECPYCWQHYEISHADREKDFVCICCDQSFNGRDALVIPGNYQKLWLGLAIGIGVFAIALLTVNLFLWRQLRLQSDAISALAAVEAGKPVGSLVPNRLPPPGDGPAGLTAEEPEQLEEKLNHLTGTLAILTEEQRRISGKSAGVEQKMEVMTKGLKDIRYQISALNIANRLGELEKSVYQLEQSLKSLNRPAAPVSPAP